MLHVSRKRVAAGIQELLTRLDERRERAVGQASAAVDVAQPEVRAERESRVVEAEVEVETGT